jgi:flagellar biosynthesis protein
MASSDRDADRPGPGKSGSGKANAGTDDPIGPRRPRWTEPRARAPVAIALDYKREGRVDSKQGPRVAATGRGAVAEQILQIAFERGIPVREDADLAEILSTLEVDSVIPVDALAAVAEILSYLYRLNGKVMDGRTGTDEADAALGDTSRSDSEGAPR